jgi:hypothetical protein
MTSKLGTTSPARCPMKCRIGRRASWMCPPCEPSAPPPLSYVGHLPCALALVRRGTERPHSLPRSLSSHLRLGARKRGRHSHGHHSRLPHRSAAAAGTALPFSSLAPRSHDALRSRCRALVNSSCRSATVTVPLGGEPPTPVAGPRRTTTVRAATTHGSAQAP